MMDFSKSVTNHMLSYFLLCPNFLAIITLCKSPCYYPVTYRKACLPKVTANLQVELNNGAGVHVLALQMVQSDWMCSSECPTSRMSENGHMTSGLWFVDSIQLYASHTPVVETVSEFLPYFCVCTTIWFCLAF